MSDFGDAFKAMVAGRKYRRDGWSDITRVVHRKQNGGLEETKTTIITKPFVMKDEDIFADDWRSVE